LQSIFSTDRLKVDRKYTFLIWRKSCLDPYSEQIISMSNAKTPISSLGVSLVCRPYTSQIGCMSSAKIRLSCDGVRDDCSPRSAQLSCKSFVIIRILSFVESQVSRQISIYFGFRYTQSNKFYHLYLGKFRSFNQQR
jgi:hypothetical protein